MTDYAKPTTVGDALREQRLSLKYQADRLRADAAMLIARAETVEKIAWDLDADADKYDQYQPDPTKPDVRVLRDIAENYSHTSITDDHIHEPTTGGERWCAPCFAWRVLNGSPNAYEGAKV